MEAAREAQALAPCAALSFNHYKIDRSTQSVDPEVLEGRLSTGKISYIVYERKFRIFVGWVESRRWREHPTPETLCFLQLLSEKRP